MNQIIDKELVQLIDKELKRQQNHVELIASENYVSPAILKIAGSVLTNKYAEGYPGKRYYGGCEFIDEIEILAIERLKKIFGAEHANVQPHSGSQANAAAYQALLQPNDIVLAMDLNSGGHLTHGHKLNFSGINYNFHFYSVNRDTQQLDYDEILNIALEVKPKLIVAGASAYSKKIDFSKFKEIADKVGAKLMVDMAHIAGLVAAGLHPSPIKYADVVTTTTHKTLRGPRGGAILCTKNIMKDIDRSVFPGQQGGPLEHIIACKAQAFEEALQPEFKKYQEQVIKNCQKLVEVFQRNSWEVISGGSDNHLLMIDVKKSIDMTGKDVEKMLQDINIICNKNMIPFDKANPFTTSGIRLGTPAMTTRGWKEKEFEKLANIIINYLAEKNINNEIIKKYQEQVNALLINFPIYNFTV